jgi:cysteine-rich repeat protein
VVDPGEQCDDGNDEDTDACPTTCELAFCGDGFTQMGVEECDDGNDVETDDCVPVFCQAASCGDGFVHEGQEECDDGNMGDDDDCPTSCENAFCGDGFKWQGEEECDDGNMVDDDVCTTDCVSNGVFYKGSFTQGVPSNQQHCNDWNAWRGQLGGFQFSRIQLWGSNDMVGRSCEDPQKADQICQALADGVSASVQCGGFTWYATGNGGCSGGQMELSADQPTCSCGGQWVVRPCINHQDWGGIKTTSCNAPTQTIEVVCQ